MQGIPGSGKSEMAISLKYYFEKSNYNYSVSICSANFYMIENGVYKFNPNKLPINHNLNQIRFEEKLKAGINIVICDNTNITKEWADPYITLAKKYNYSIRVIRICCDLDEAINSNQHDCSRETIARMYRKMEDLL